MTLNFHLKFSKLQLSWTVLKARSRKRPLHFTLAIHGNSNVIEIVKEGLPSFNRCVDVKHFDVRISMDLRVIYNDCKLVGFWLQSTARDEHSGKEPTQDSGLLFNAYCAQILSRTEYKFIWSWCGDISSH